MKFTATTLDVQVIAGRNLISKDSNGFSDPYCEVYLLDEKGEKIKSSKKKTAVIKKNLNPQWNETFSFKDIKPSLFGGIQIDMYDEDKLSSEFMGQVTFSPSDLAADSNNNDKPLWRTLQSRPGKSDAVLGEINLKCVAN